MSVTSTSYGGAAAGQKLWTEAARRRMFSDGSSYLTILGPHGDTLFVSKDMQDVCIPSLITAYRAGVGRDRQQMAEATR